MFKRLFGGDDVQQRQPPQGLEKTSTTWRDRLLGIFGPVDITPETWLDLEEHLIRADVGAAASGQIVADVRAMARDARVGRADELWRVLQRVMVRALGDESGAPASDSRGRPHAAGAPHVMMIVGVNGTGKTTTIAKLAHNLKGQGVTVVLVAADTFRAAAIDQLQAWGERAGVPVLAASPGDDPASVVFDALSSTSGRRADVVIIDTAGRLHTQTNLMQELEKIRRVCGRVMPGAPHETLLVLDATTGQNGMAQARSFTAAVDVDGLVLAKLDSSAKGGVAFAVRRELGVPIRYVGTGEGLGDLAAFDAESYVDGILGTREGN